MRLIALSALAACLPAPIPPERTVPRPAAPMPEREALPAAGDAALERAVLAELNRLRADPGGYAEALDAMATQFDGKVLRRPGERVGIATQEGPRAVHEAAAALRATGPLAPLRPEHGLTHAARDHAHDHGPRGGVGHTGTDGSSTADRVNRYGQWLKRLTESIEYGSTTGRYVVLALLVDDGVPNRGHRRNLLDPAVSVVGVGCASHARYGKHCVIELAGEYVTR